MARAALFHMDLDDIFWVHATKYAALLRARLPPARGGTITVSTLVSQKAEEDMFSCVRLRSVCAENASRDDQQVSSKYAGR